jgi:hypothetical protein
MMLTSYKIGLKEMRLRFDDVDRIWVLVNTVINVLVP